jgi:large-conductance mechanosensitive channel
MKSSTSSTPTLLLALFLCGVILTLLTGLVESTPPMLVGAVWHGYPLAWLFRMVVAPQYNPWKVDFGNFIADVVVWFVIVAIVAFIAARLAKPRSQ